MNGEGTEPVRVTLPGPLDVEPGIEIEIDADLPGVEPVQATWLGTVSSGKDLARTMRMMKYLDNLRRE